MEDQDNKQKYQSLSVDYVKYKTTLTDKYLSRKTYVEKDPRLITAFIPGTIRKVFVKPGSKVKTGDKLLILDAMKMNNIIVAPMDSVVKEIHAKPGKTVAKNELLIELN